MKRKTLSRIFSILLAALLITGGLSVTAHAETPQTEPAEETPAPEPQPLTPEGNMTLVDDIGGDAAADKQFIVVQSRGGDYFYIIIDNAAEGDNRVHFLNQVDEADLLSIIDEDLQSIQPTPEPTPEPTPAPQVTEPEPTTQPEPDTTKTDAASEALRNLILLLVVVLLGGGSALVYFKVIKPKQSVKGGTDLDEFDLEEWEDEPEPGVSEDDGPQYVDLDNGQEDGE